MKQNFIDHQTEYESLRPFGVRLMSSVKEEMAKIFHDEKITLAFPIQARLKEWSSIEQKSSSGRFKINKTITELQDLVGFRIILLFLSDIDKVLNLFKDSFSVERNYYTQDRLKSDQFGYSSLHIIAKIPTEWMKVPSFKGLDNISFEIQVRTLSQHMWAEVSNIFQYKQEENTPKELLRSIGRLSALLETVDLEFERLTNLREDYINNIPSEPSKKTDIELNVDVLAETMDKMLPENNKAFDEDYAGLLHDLKQRKIIKLNKFIDFINENLDFATQEDKEFVARIINEGRSYNSSRLIKGVYFNHSGLIRMMLGRNDPGYSTPFT